MSIINCGQGRTKELNAEDGEPDINDYDLVPLLVWKIKVMIMRDFRRRINCEMSLLVSLLNYISIGSSIVAETAGGEGKEEEKNFRLTRSLLSVCDINEARRCFSLHKRNTRIESENFPQLRASLQLIINRTSDIISTDGRFNDDLWSDLYLSAHSISTRQRFSINCDLFWSDP